MTREESLKLASYEENPYYYQRLINKIYDEFESQNEQLENRSCDNCKNKIFTEGGYYCNLPYHKIYVELYFCCNKWQNKQ